MTSTGQAVLFAIIGAVLFSVRDYTIQGELGHISILALNSARGVIAGGLITAIFFKQIRQSFSWKIFASLTIAAGLAFFANQMLLLAGLQMSGVSNGVFFKQLLPILVFVIAIAFKLESWKQNRFIALFIPFLTLGAFVYYRYSPDLFSNLTGNLVILASFACYAAGICLIKQISGSMHIGGMTGLFLIVGGLFSGFFSVGDYGALFDVALNSANNLIMLTVDILLGIGVAYLCLFHSLKSLKPASTMAFFYLLLPASGIIQWLTGHGGLDSLLLIVTGICTASCVFVVQSE